MAQVTLSLRMRKVRSSELAIALKHNGRTNKDIGSPHFTKRSDKKRLDLNSSRIHHKYELVKNTDDLIVLLKNEMKESKMKGICPEKARFPRLKTHRKNKDKSIIETAFVREFILQIGDAKDEVDLPDDEYLNIVYYLLKILQNDGMKIDIHRDESAVHVHVLTTYWNSKLGQFNNTLRKPNSLHELQVKVNKYARTILKPLGYEVVPIVPKSVSKHKHIPLALYERYMVPLKEELARKQHELQVLEHDKSVKEKIISEWLVKTLESLQIEMQQEYNNAVFKDDVVKKYRSFAEFAYVAVGKMFKDMDEKEDNSKNLIEGEDDVINNIF